MFWKLPEKWEGLDFVIYKGLKSLVSFFTYVFSLFSLPFYPLTFVLPSPYLYLHLVPHSAVGVLTLILYAEALL